MTDKKLVQALRNCGTHPVRCKSCPYNGVYSGVKVCVDVMKNDAADRLEALMAENERLKAGKDTDAPTKWVSVEERLPELNMMVVGVTKDNPFSRYVPQVVHRNEHGWVFTYSMRYVTDVTHWMPLPSAEGVE